VTEEDEPIEPVEPDPKPEVPDIGAEIPDLEDDPVPESAP
jgi:hypothetical protein